MTDLLRVYRARRNVAYQTARLHTEIRHARIQGATLREIAAAAGISHEQVRRIQAR